MSYLSGNWLSFSTKVSIVDNLHTELNNSSEQFSTPYKIFSLIDPEFKIGSCETIPIFFLSHFKSKSLIFIEFIFISPLFGS